MYNPSKVRLSALRTAVAAQEKKAGWPDIAMWAYTTITGNSGSLAAGMRVVAVAIVDGGLLAAVVRRPAGGGGRPTSPSTASSTGPASVPRG